MTLHSAPPPPTRELPDPSWEHSALYKSVRDAIATLPIYFRTETHISGIMATDLHTLNMAKLNDVSLCGIKTAFWREFLKAFQESTTDSPARTALERLRQRVQMASDLPSPRSQAALTIIAELERLLDLPI